MIARERVSVSCEQVRGQRPSCSRIEHRRAAEGNGALWWPKAVALLKVQLAVNDLGMTRAELLTPIFAGGDAAHAKETFNNGVL
jgi:hypothetical protein